MDILSIVGVIAGIGAILTGMTLEGGEIGSLLNLPAFIIVFGGTIGAALLQSPVKLVMKALKMLSWIFRPPTMDLREQREKIVGLAMLARKNGLLGLEPQIDMEEDEFIKMGLQLLIDGCQPATLRSMLELELSAIESNELQASKVFEAMGGYAPTIGIIGAVLGLIHVMQNLASPALLGAGIATAFVATVYGVGSANLIFLPIANKLKTQVLAMSQGREMLIEGFNSIAMGENPRIIEIKLSSYVNN
ncbi:MAG: flagellar motor protein [Methylococcales bacterium]|nr:flagellar motor protein [Methylococcales bacterium]MDD5755004.1 flagellar motor protein [Methylococcales bacterium]